MGTLVTQTHIARHLNISQAIVSRVLNGNVKAVSRETAKRILKASRELKYNMRKQSQTQFIGVLMPGSPAGASFLMRLFSGIQDEARRRNAIPIQHILKKGDALREFMEQVSGLISVVELSDGLTGDLHARKPVVYLHHHGISGKHDCVLEDNRGGFRQAIRKLFELGHRRFGYFDVRPWGVAQAERYGAFHQVLSEFDLPVPPSEWVATPRRKERSTEDVERQLREFLSSLRSMKERPTALLMADAYAIPFLRLSRESGFSVPGDFSVVGYDDNPECELSRPTLSSIAQPLEEMGKEALGRLMDRIGNPDMPPRIIRVSMEFKERGSIGRVKLK
ncbi:MAG: LacI family DNA-binding transcriptional regulator [Victivallales bacterium]